MLMKMDIDFSYDFKWVKEFEVSERLSEEELAEGLEPETMTLKFCVTHHADQRSKEEGRFFDWEDVESLVLEKAHKFFHLKSGAEFAIVNERKTMAVICRLLVHQGEMVLVVKTVVRKVLVSSYGEREKKVFVTRKTVCI
ncbi:hypothetical protein GsuE55_38130 (plasmid) [Geobacillus subterraneus]|uniref:Uncharacterized protein n=2 Tax=Geobacillus subterraneus TaxID=129338 RepID=A0A679FS75_9BACL|nr:hypothetical protein GsuE55_38130 [Geobacillus subterraneus]